MIRRLLVPKFRWVVLAVFSLFFFMGLIRGVFS